MEKEALLNHFSDVSDELLNIVSSTEEEQLNKLPATGGWSVAQIAEHLWMTYAAVRVMNGNVMPTDRAPDAKVQGLKAEFEDHSIIMTAPQGVLPSAEPIDKNKLLEGLRKRIAQFKEVIATKDLSPTCNDFSIPGRGPFTVLEWAYFNIYHTQRHLKQMKAILKS